MKIKRLLLKMGGVCFQTGLCGHVQDEERAMARKKGWAFRRRGQAQEGGAIIFGHTTKRSFFFSHKTRVAKCHDSADSEREKDKRAKRTRLKDGQV